MIGYGWKLKRVSAPAVEPVTVDEARAHVRQVSTNDDAQLARMVAAAREAAEAYTRRAFVSQVWEAGYQRFPRCPFYIPKPPLIEVISIGYTDDAGVDQVLPTTDYIVDDYSEPSLVIRPNAVTWPALTEAGIRVRLRFRAGYEGEGSPAAEDASGVPDLIKSAILVHAAEMYENRDVATEMPQACIDLLHPFRVYGWGDA